MVICLERGAHLHVAKQMQLALTVSCLSKIQIGFTFLVPAHLGSPRKRAVKCVCVCVDTNNPILAVTKTVSYTKSEILNTCKHKNAYKHTNT